MIKATVSVSKEMILHDPDYIEEYVHRDLSRQLTEEISKQVLSGMTIHRNYDTLTDTHSYTATYPSVNGAVGSITSTSGYNGITSSQLRDVQIKLRVVEYTKGGKVTRVELQKYDEESDAWSKIPRIQIEE